MRVTVLDKRDLVDDAMFSTSGRGLWGMKKNLILVNKIVAVIDKHFDPYFGELRVYFDRRTWNVDKHGLIYTDPLFLKQLKALLKKKGFSGSVEYSEQGMQGNDYVSLDIGKAFIRSLLANAEHIKIKKAA